MRMEICSRHFPRNNPRKEVDNFGIKLSSRPPGEIAFQERLQWHLHLLENSWKNIWEKGSLDSFIS